MSLDDTTILSLLEMRDPIAVLSFYVGITPEGMANPQPPWQIEIRNGIRDVRQRARDELDHERWRAVHDRLDSLEAELSWLVDVKESGRGRALFVAVQDGRTERVALQVPFRERVLMDRSAFVRPLIAAQDEGRPAGIAVLHRGGARLLEWRLGEAQELAHREFTFGDAQLAGQKSGPAGNNPAMGQTSLTHRERFESRLDENRQRMLRAVAADLSPEMRERGWDRLVVAGDARQRQAFIEALAADDGLTVLEDDHLWESEPAHRIAEAAWPTLRSVHRARELALAEQARDRALAGGSGALGLPDTLAALNEGRVSHLLFHGDLSVSGWRAPEGGLLFPERGVAEVTGLEVVEEDLLVERMIERALHTSARVTPVEGDAAELLEEFGGVAALLRW